MSSRSVSVQLFVSVFLAAWILRLALALATDAFHNFMRMDMERVALSLARTGVFGNPFHTPTGPTALVPPGYVLFLAAIFHGFGAGVKAELIKVLTCTAASSLRCALTPWLAWRLGLSRTVVAASAILSVIWIGAFDTEIQGEWDTPYTACLIIALVYLHYSRPLLELSKKSAVVRGLLWGIAALINPAVLSILAGFMAVEIWRAGRSGFPRLVPRQLCVAAAIVLMLFPWALRNRTALGSWVWLRSGFGLEMQISYHDGSSWANAWNIRPSLAHPEQPSRDREISSHPFINPSESRRVERLGEAEYCRQKLGEALQWTRRNPAASARLAAQHVFYFWFPPGSEFYRSQAGKAIGIYTMGRWALTIFGWIGLFLLYRSHRRIAIHVGSILALFPLIYYLVNWSSRYRIPIEWVLVLLSAASMGWAWEQVRSLGWSWAPPVAPQRWNASTR